MPDPNPTIGELFKAKVVTDEQVNAAVEASLAKTMRVCDQPPGTEATISLSHRHFSIP
ncbi:hypothetical protein [Methylorubrum aminovorans]